MPPVFGSLVDWHNPSDPLRRQVIPSGEELRQALPRFSVDPLEERRFLKAPGLIAKYHGRVLLRLTGDCPIHCRYCFRRHDSFADVPETMVQWQPALEWIRSHEEIREVIFSGGDPLMVATARLAELTTRLATIGHLRRLRIHSRMPVCSPGRINDGLLHWLSGSPLPILMVIHVNHPAELGPEACRALARLATAGIPLLNQSVLLKGVNDTIEVLTELSDTLVQNRVLPYYLHLLDPVLGSAHFQVDAALARQLVEEMRHRLGGYAVPRLAREVPGKAAKQVLDGGAVLEEK
ncbi:MAG: KamA family radical SAM protein [Magnetococcales bacterium]|nr:KamA family radical SAM protein [Magnetococcales bacterium]